MTHLYSTLTFPISVSHTFEGYMGGRGVVYRNPLLGEIQPFKEAVHSMWHAHFWWYTHFASAHCDADTMCSTLSTFFFVLLTLFWRWTPWSTHYMWLASLALFLLNHECFFYWKLFPSKNSEACPSSLSPTIKKCFWRFCFFKPVTSAIFNLFLNVFELIWRSWGHNI